MRLRLDNVKPIVYVDTPTEHGGVDMVTILLADGTTYFFNSISDAVKIFERRFGTGVTIVFVKEEKSKKDA